MRHPNEQINMKVDNIMYSFAFLLVIIMTISTVSAVPQVILSSINLSISNGTLMIRGEGINLIEQVGSGNNSFYYNRENIPITISRDFQENNTDVAVLIHALSENSNVTNQWQNCMYENGQLKINNSLLNKDYQYQTNFSNCQVSLATQQSASATLSQQMIDKDSQIKDLSNQRLYIGAAALLCIGAAFYFWNQNKAKVTASPLATLPTNARY